MRILSVSNVPLDPTLGSGYVISGYAERLRARGHLVTTIEPRDYLPWPRLRGAHRLRMLFGYTATARRAIAREKFDLVEFWGGESWRVVRQLANRPDRPLLVGRSNGLETFARATLDRAGFSGPGVLGRWFDRWQALECAFRDVDALTTVSHYDAQFAQNHSYQPPERLLALENPLDDEWFQPTLPPERPRVLAYFGSWLPQKGADILPHIFAAVLRQRADWRGRIVGAEPAAIAPHFPADVRARIEFVAPVRDKARLRTLYGSSAVTLLPSAYESFGLVAAEAAACGCALVASPVGFAAALRDGEEALLVPTRSVTAWTATVSRVLADDALRRRVAAAGRTRAQTLRWAAAVDSLEAFYGRLLETRRLVAPRA